MRLSIALAAVAAMGAYAVPQIQPITQIADGQIQAPPATASIGWGPPVASYMPGAPVASYASNSLPLEGVAWPSPTMGPMPTDNQQIGNEWTASLTSGSFPPMETNPAYQSMGAATANMVPLGGLALALLAFLA